MTFLDVAVLQVGEADEGLDDAGDVEQAVDPAVGGDDGVGQDLDGGPSVMADRCGRQPLVEVCEGGRLGQPRLAEVGLRRPGPGISSPSTTTADAVAAAGSRRRCR